MKHKIRQIYTLNQSQLRVYNPRIPESVQIKKACTKNGKRGDREGREGNPIDNNRREMCIASRKGMNTVINFGPEVSFVNAGRNVQQMTQPAQQPPPCSSAVASVAAPCVPFKESCLVELALMVERRVFFLSALSSTAGGGAFRIQRWTTVLIAGDGVVQEGKDSPSSVLSS